MIDSPYNIVLASASPRRKELLEGLGLSFTVRIIDGIDESVPNNIKTEDIPLYIAKKKANEYIKSIRESELIITADTIVALDDRVLGKPRNSNEAFDMLHLLSGRWHRVITGVTLSTATEQRYFSVTTDVKFATLTEREIELYINRYRPFDKAGAYGIQEWIGMIGVEEIRGSYFNVVGLPIQRLYQEIKNFTHI